MILILSEEIDYSSDIVCSWLNYYRCSYIRINKEKASNYETNVEFDYTIKDWVILSNNAISFNFSQIQKIWFRRGFLNFKIGRQGLSLDESIINSINGHLNTESDTLTSFLYYILKKKKSINNPLVYNYNKLIALYEAQKLRFNIPATIISCNGEEIKNFIDKQGNAIVKNIQDIMHLNVSNNVFPVLGTMQVKKEDITEKKYWYSLFQKEIEKKYELRIFYFLGKMYAAAIFSQLDKESSIDCRNVSVNASHPNRIVPFNLPSTVKNKIKKLMEILNLESGSIDMIVDNSNEYYFLEVNPVGQFNYVSQLCNYNIEKDIAKYLSL